MVLGIPKPASQPADFAIDTGSTSGQHQKQSNTINIGRNTTKSGQSTAGEASTARRKRFAATAVYVARARVRRAARMTNRNAQNIALGGGARHAEAIAQASVGSFHRYFHGPRGRARQRTRGLVPGGRPG